MDDEATSLDCSKLQLHFQYSYSYISVPNTWTTCHGHSQQAKSTPLNQLEPHLLAAFHQLLFLFWAVLRSIPCWRSKPVHCHRFPPQNRTSTKTGGVNCTLNLVFPSRLDATLPSSRTNGVAFLGPKWWALEKVTNSLQNWQFLVSMLDFWGVTSWNFDASHKYLFFLFLRYPHKTNKSSLKMAILKMIFLFQRWNVLGIISLKCYLFCFVKIHGSGLQCIDVSNCGGYAPYAPPKSGWRRDLQHAQPTWKHITSHMNMIFPGFQFPLSSSHHLFGKSCAKSDKTVLFPGDVSLQQISARHNWARSDPYNFCRQARLLINNSHGPSTCGWCYIFNENPPKTLPNLQRDHLDHLTVSASWWLLSSAPQHLKPYQKLSVSNYHRRARKNKPRLMVDQWQKVLDPIISKPPQTNSEFRLT